MARKRKKTPGSRVNTRDKTPARQQARRKKRRTGKRTLHYLLLLLLVTGAGAVLSLTVFFQIEDIQVIGVDRYEPDHIIAVSGIQKEDNLLRIPTQEVEKRILDAFPYIESVKVVRRFPPRVELQVTQCTPAAAVLDGDRLGLITREGKLLETGDLYIPPEIPVIKGLTLQGFSPGDLLGEEDHPENQERLRMLDYLLDAAEKIGFGPITNVDVSDRLNMKMVYEARLVLELGSEADMEYKLTFLREVINDLGPEDQAKLDATNVRNKRILVKWGKVEEGVFTPLPGSAKQILEKEQDEMVTKGSSAAKSSP
ncbi:MAG: cell division protein FtsQ/DivIB [Oscillospiraceae bacterium]